MNPHLRAMDKLAHAREAQIAYLAALLELEEVLGVAVGTSRDLKTETVPGLVAEAEKRAAAIAHGLPG